MLQSILEELITNHGPASWPDPPTPSVSSSSTKNSWSNFSLDVEKPRKQGFLVGGRGRRGTRTSFLGAAELHSNSVHLGAAESVPVRRSGPVAHDRKSLSSFFDVPKRTVAVHPRRVVWGRGPRSSFQPVEPADVDAEEQNDPGANDPSRPDADVRDPENGADAEEGDGTCPKSDSQDETAEDKAAGAAARREVEARDRAGYGSEFRST